GESQLVETLVTVSWPGRLVVRREGWVVPSSTFVSLAAEKVTVGATLLTVTDWCAVAPVAPSESVALAVRSAVSGPSGKVHWKLPEVLPLMSESATFVPCGESQLVETLVTVSWPG